MDELKDMIKM